MFLKTSLILQILLGKYLLLRLVLSKRIRVGEVWPVGGIDALFKVFGAVIIDSERELPETRVEDFELTFFELAFLLLACCKPEPVFDVPVVVKILAPFDEVVDLVVESLVGQLCELFIVEWVIVELFKLFLKAS